MDLNNIINKLQVQLHVPLGTPFTYPEDKKIVLQINLKPLLHLNAIHFIVLQIIKTFLNLGENYYCSIVLCDKWILYRKDIQNIQCESEAIQAMDFFYKVFSLNKIDCSKIEFIPETVLWKTNCFKDDFIKNVIQLSFLAEKEISYNNSISIFSPVNYINILIGVMYESVIKPCFIFTAGDELKTIWKSVRERNKLKEIFGNDFYSPIMMEPDILYSFDDPNKILSTDCENDPFSKSFNMSLIKSNAINQKYKNIILKYNKISPFVVTNDVPSIINEFRRTVYS